MNRHSCIPAFVVAGMCSTACAQGDAVDFRYAPAVHLTAICFPGDWQKTAVTERGTLAYDFGPGPYARPLTEVSVGDHGVPLSLRTLAIENPRMPIALAEFSGEGVAMLQEAFAIPMGSLTPPSVVFAGGAVRRLGGLNGADGWAHPPEGTDPAFRSVAWGTNRPIMYRVRVARGSARKVALGICEPYKSVTGQRVMELRVEGAPPRTVEALKDTVKNRPTVYFFDARDANNDGELAIEVHGSPLGLDPNVTLSGFWVFAPGTIVNEDDVLRGHVKPEVSWDCGKENTQGASSPRVDGLLATFTGGTISPEVRIHSGRTLSFDSSAGTLAADGFTVITRPVPTGMQVSGDDRILLLPAGTHEVQVLVVHGPLRAGQFLPDLRDARGNAAAYWARQTTIPFGRIVVPDAELQYLLDASIRNLYQIAEWVDGAYQFQPGPSVYRGLWIHDGAWHTAAALMLGDSLAARHNIEACLRFQRADGRVSLIEPFPIQRETPLVVSMIAQYAAMTGDLAWLRAHWGNVTRGISWVRKAHASTYADRRSRYYGLFPPGFADGGLGGLEPEYGTTYWGLIGLHEASHAAISLGERDSARSWDRLAAEILTAFRAAAARDARTDAFGNRYLPMIVGDTSASPLPQQANWGMLDAQGVGQLFSYDDTLVNGTLAMLDAVSKEGLPQSVGWLKNGVWPFLGALHGIAHAVQRHYGRATDLLTAYANHASPLGTWVEEQLPRDVGTRTTGDASNATASSLYIRLLRSLLVLERKDTLSLLEGLPQAWLRSGATVALQGVGTEFGTLNLMLTVSADGKKAEIRVDPLSRGNACLVRLDLQALRAAGYRMPERREIVPVYVAPGTASVRLSFVKWR